MTQLSKDRSNRPVPDTTPPRRHTGMQRLVPLLAFFQSSTAGGAVLVASAIVALLWSNSSLAPAYQMLLQLPLGLTAAATASPCRCTTG